MLQIEELENGNKNIIVPQGIRYISDWKDYNLSDFNFPHILDKKIPGCGFTEYCLRSNQNVILCSPRRILLSNKELQHNYVYDEKTEKSVFNPCAEFPVFYFKNSLDNEVESDKDLSKSDRSSGVDPVVKELTSEEIQQVLDELEAELNDYISRCIFSMNKPVKILVTYDSFKYVRWFLEKRGCFDQFHVVVDEFQAIFTDSSFKSDTELEFVYQLQDLSKVCFVSATPMIDKYLKQIDEFKDLPYYELDWEKDDPLRVITPDLQVRPLKSLSSQAGKIINQYKSGKFEEGSYCGNIVKSTEAVIYVNSVANILSIIKKWELTPEECNILCADTYENRKRVKRVLGKKFDIGEIPAKGQYHKMFTFCTRTVYLGADFYSTCARTFILSDANINTLTVDITLDLPQILGRQRLVENPWKNRAEMYIKALKPGGAMTKEEFDAILEHKKKTTLDILNSYSDTRDEAKHSVALKYQRDARNSNYKYDFVAVNTHGGKDLVPVFNNLVCISQQRAFEIQQTDYKDRFSVFDRAVERGLISRDVKETVSKFMNNFEKIDGFSAKLRSLCESGLSESIVSALMERVPLVFKNCYELLGPERCKALSYNKTEITREIANLKISKFSKEPLINSIYSKFLVGSKYTKQEIKSMLRNIYEDLDYLRTPKASDLDEYFELRSCQITNKETGKRDNGFEIIKKKD